MTNAYTAGAVTAKITIDTKQFTTNIDSLIAKVEVLKSNLEAVGSFNAVSKRIKELETELNTAKNTFTELNKKIDDYKKQMKTLQSENANLNKQITELNKALKNNQTTLDKSAKSRKNNAEAIKTENKLINDNVKKVNEEVKANEKLNASLKKTETQAKKTSAQYSKMGTDLNKSFTKELYKAIAPINGRSVELKPIYEQLKSQFKPLVKSRMEFDKLWSDALMRMGASLYPTRDPGKFVKIGGRNFGYIDKSALKSVEEVKKTFQGVTKEETKATVEATKLNNEVSKIGSNNGMDKLEKDVKEVNTELKKVETQAKKTTNQFLKDGKLRKKYQKFHWADMDFMEEVYARAKVAKEAGKTKISARSVFGLPTMKEIKSLKFPDEGYPYAVDIPSIESLDKDTYKEWKKYAQSRMKEMMEYMDLSFSKEKFGDTKSVKVWNDVLDKFETLGTIDISKMTDYGSVSEFRAELEKTVDIEKVLEDKQKQYNNELNKSSKEASQLNSEISKIGNNKGVDEAIIDVKKLGETEVKTSKETAKLNRELSKVKSSKNASNYDLTTEQLQTASTALNNFANMETKTSAVVETATKKNIQNKAKEAKEIKYYTREELNLLERLHSEYAGHKADPMFGLSSNLYPIDHKYASERYTSILNSNKRKHYMTGGGINVEPWQGDYAKSFQKRMKSLLKDIGVTISSKSDGEFKKVKDKFTGKMVEYLDLSDLHSNADWIRKVRSQIIDAELMAEDLYQTNRPREVRKKYPNAQREEVRRIIKQWDKIAYERYGIEKNPYMEKYFNDKYTKDYKKLAQQVNEFDASGYELKNATKALNTFERGLKSTTVDWGKLNNTARQFKQYSNNWDTTTAQIQRATKALWLFERQNKGLLGRRKTQAGKEIASNTGVDYERLLNKANVQLNMLPKLEQIGYEAGRKWLKDYLKMWSEAPITVNRSVKEIETAMSKFVNLNKRNSYVPLGGNDFKRYSNNWELTAQQMQKGTQGFQTLQRRLKSTEISVEGFNRIYSELGTAMGSGNHYIQNALNSFRELGNGVDIQKARLKSFAEQTKATFETMQVELAKANAATYKYWKQVRGQSSRQEVISKIGKGENQRTINWGTSNFNEQPLQIAGYSDYVAKITEVNKALAEFKVQQQSVNNNINQTYSAFEKASQGVALLTQKMEQYEAIVNKRTQTFTKTGQQLTQLESKLNHFSSLSNKNSTTLGKFGERITILKDKLGVLNQAFKQGQLNEKQYDSEVNRLSKDVAKLDKEMQVLIRDLSLKNSTLSKNSAEYQKLDANVRKSGKGLTSFNNGVVQTAHSGRILSNTLYQIRGALLSLKMIFTAMGGMALWGFAMEISEGVKQTFKAKNEMEAQLKQNENVGDGGIEYFRKNLDKLTKTYKKVNKYSIGETVSSIGLEFDLTAKQMKDALPIVTMIQSEYVRAGRTSEEAALAVKDILQGEFQRLSRETGVGKEELVAYGWDEDKTNIDGLLKALKKAALDRHWDVFAKKATSLNDVLTITKSRFEETGADLLDSASPMIVEGFNMIIGAIDSVSKSFNGLNSFWRNTLWIGGGTAIFGGILTALPMVIKGMGLADIATIGWGKSILTTALNLDKLEVAQYGLGKAIAAVVTGTKASELSSMRASKAILGRLLGVKQSTLAEHGFLSALVESKAMLKGQTQLAISAGAGFGNLRQKIIYLAKGEIVANEASATWGKTIKSLITSTKLWRLAILGVVGIGLVAWLSSVAVQADLVKKRIDAFNEIVETGKEKLADAREESESYQAIMDKYEWSDKKEDKIKYKQAKANKDIVDGNIKQLEQANQLTDSYKAQNDEREKAIKIAQNKFLKSNYMTAGHDEAEATEKQSKWVDKINQAQYEITNSYNKQYDWLEASSKHINENLKHMQETNRTQKDMDKYIMEYSTVAEEAGEHLKQYYQGDLTSGLYYLLDRLKLMWIDLWNNEAFTNFWKSLQKTRDDLKPTVYAIKDGLQGIGEVLLQYFSTDQGRWVFSLAAIGTGLALIGLKVAKWVTGSDSVYSVLKKVGGKLKDVAKGWKDVATNAEEANTKTGGTTTTTTTVPPTTTGGTVEGGEKAGFWKTVGEDAKNTGRTMFKYMGYIVAAMAIAATAIAALMLPMGALAVTGWAYKQMEPQVKKGIEGLQTIAPTVIAILTPMIALMYVFDKYKVDSSRIVSAFKTSAIGIAAGIVLVTEAIVLLNAPLLGLAILGSVYNGVKDAAKQGVKAMDLINQALYSLLPWVPVFAATIAASALVLNPATAPIGAVLLGGAALGIGAGILLVTEAIIGLVLPLEALREIGNNFPDLEGVKQGAEAIKVTAEALKYVSDAMTYLTLIDINLILQNITDVVKNFTGVDLGSSLTKLTEEGGVLDQINEFTKAFNKYDIVSPEPERVTALAAAGDGIKTVGDAMEKVKTAMNSMPDEFKQGGNGTGTPAMSYDQTTASTSVNTGDVEGYFDRFKEPLRQLKSFVYDFNNSEDFNIEQIDTGRVDNINSAASMIETVNNAIQNVKTTMQNIGSSGHEAAFAQGGALMAFGYDLFHMTGAESINNGQSSGEYKSSLGSQLKEMENVVSDIFTFQSNISSMSGGQGENANVDGATAMVTTIQQAISDLSQSLSDAVPTFEGKGNAISSAIIKGITDGMANLGNDISSKVSTAIDAAKPTAETYGKGLGWKVQSGFESNLKIDTVLSTEVSNALNAIDDSKAQEFYDKGNALGSAFATGFKDGAGIHSPGYAAQAMQSEIGYIGQYLNDGIVNLPNLAMQLANSVSSNFNPSLSLGNFELPNITQFQQGVTTITDMANNAKTQVSTKFNEMRTNIGTSFTNIKTNVGTSFGNILSNTRTSLNSMKSATVKNIGNIKTSWKGMQDSLIASAEHIKSQTGQKIDKLKTNLGDFWNKIKHPDQLISGSAGGKPTGTIRRRSMPKSTRSSYAGSPMFKPKTSRQSPDDNIKEYLACMLQSGKPCYAGWKFDWTNKISDKFNGWNTHFNKFNLDSHLNVGKFKNSNFPVKGQADVFKDYVYEVLKGTTYSFYFNSKFGDDPAAALRAGSFNCWDGTNIIIALARAFGLDASQGHGSWNGVGHMFARVAGIGVIDPTAIQRGYGFTSPKVKGYSAGSIPRKYASSKGDMPNMGNTTNNNVEVHIHGNVYGVDDLHKEIERGVNKAQRKLFTKSLSGV